jgi:cytoskeleton protein RodZ
LIVARFRQDGLVITEMDELGHILREARETKGLTLEEVQQQIRINARFLAALEEGEYERLPTPVHARGFLRNYARFLNLDPKPLVDRYEINHVNRRPSPAKNGSARLPGPLPPPTAEDKLFFDPVNVEVGDHNRRDPESALRLLIIASLLIALALVLNRFVPLFRAQGDTADSFTEGVTNVIRDMTNSDEPELDLNPLIVPGEVITSTSRNNFGELPTPAPTRAPLPATLETIQLRLEITERGWLEVTIDGNVVFTGIARRNDSFDWEAQDEAKVVTGNAVGVFVTINDIQLGRMGERGENKEEVWQTTK